MKDARTCPVGYFRGGTGSCVKPKTVTVYARGGMIWTYLISQLDGIMKSEITIM